MKKISIFAFFYFSFLPTTFACDFSPPEMKTSEFIADKAVFWGRATAKKWNPYSLKALEHSTNSTFLDVEVIKPLKGEIGNHSKIWLDNKTSCGIDIPLGRIYLFVVKPIGNSDYFADMLTSSIVSNQAIISLFELDKDLQIGRYDYPPNLVTLEHNHWQEWFKNCQSAPVATRAENCLSLSELEEIYFAYQLEYEEVQNIASIKPKSWWERFWK